MYYLFINLFIFCNLSKESIDFRATVSLQKLTPYEESPPIFKRQKYYFFFPDSIRDTTEIISRVNDFLPISWQRKNSYELKIYRLGNYLSAKDLKKRKYKKYSNVGYIVRMVKRKRNIFSDHYDNFRINFKDIFNQEINVRKGRDRRRIGGSLYEPIFKPKYFF